MTVKYSSVSLDTVEQLIQPSLPLFYDSETLGLYGEVVLAQFKQPQWEEALVVEYPDNQALKDLLINKHVVCYNASYDMGLLEISPTKLDDLLYAAKTAYPLQDGYSLSTTAPQFYEGIVKADMQKSFLKKRQALTDEQKHYGALDVYALNWLWLQDDIQTVIETNSAYKVDIKAQKNALVYQHNGMPVIFREWFRARKETEKARQKCQVRLNELVGTDLNVKSYMQKQKAFPELPIDPKTGKIPTGEPAFKRLFLEGNAEPDRLEAYDLVMKTTKRRTELSDLEKYSESYIPDEMPHRIRTFFNVAGAVTGRFTSRGGDRVGYTNIQNIGRHFKHIFGYEEGEGRKIVAGDYSTAELISGCAIFKVPTMRELIMEGIDLHKSMASAIARVRVEDVTKEQRQHAKAVNFGYLFGMGIEKFQGYAYDTFGVELTINESKEAKDIYYSEHPAIAKYHKEMAKAIKRPNFTLQTALGRVIKPDRYTDALNIPVQGSIGECTKMALNFLLEDYPTLMKEGMIINTVHDSIVLDFPDEYAEEAGQALSDSMKLGWTELSKSPLFHYHDLPMGVDIDIDLHYK